VTRASAAPPATVSALAARAAALIDLGRYEDAVPLLSQALGLQPDDVLALDLLAQAQLDLDPAASLRAAQRLVEVAPDSYRGHLHVCIASLHLNQVRRATRYAREAVRLAPELPITHACLADALARRMIGRNAGLRAARRAIELAPDSPMGYLAAGNVELNHRGAKHARRWYEQASSLAPTSRPVQKNLAVAHSHLGRQDRALALTTNLLELDPRDERSRAMVDDEVLHFIIRLQQLVAAIAVVLGLVFGEDRDVEFLIAIPVTFVLVLGSRLPQLPRSLVGVGKLPWSYLRDLMRRSWLVSVEALCFVIGLLALAGISMVRELTDLALGISYFGFFLQLAVRRPTARARR
jgi:tetratricopeptide (TPR) repeat protein